MTQTRHDRPQALSVGPHGDVAVVDEQQELWCPVCGRDDGLWVAKPGRWQVWHPTRLFPCGVYPA